MNKAEYTKFYNQLIFPYAQDKPRVKISLEKAVKIQNLAQHIIEAKKKESHHIVDNGSEFTRFYTGLLGEAAMEEYLGIDIIDYSVGSSNDYNYADLSKVGLNVGIKTVEFGKFPIIHKNSVRPELINVKINNYTVVFFGYASIHTLNNYQNSDLILSSNLRRRGTKSAFYGFDKLEKVENLEQLKNIGGFYNELSHLK
ncbi:hypothetical protein ACTQ5X_06620 [Jeotgalibaca porci]|uniref:hypothetical protein n=1 Tax=Jeotgalibaca porci TaxID=1868793 RepID=UPI003F91EB27